MKARFYLRNNKVSVYVTINKVKKRYATNIECDKKKWNRGYADKSQTLVIEQLQRIEKAINEHLATSNYTEYSIQQLINEIVHNKSEDKESLKNLVDKYLIHKKVEVKKVTFSKIEKHLKDFKAFAENKALNDINPLFFADYHKHLICKDLNLSTLNTYVKNIQTFFNYLYEIELIQRKVTLKRFKAKEKEIIAITKDELQILENAKELTARLERIKDLFLFGCYTGLRFIDLQAIDKRMIQNNILTIQQQKTGKMIQIPLINEAQTILHKYKYKLPSISNQKGNVAIKDLFKKLELNRDINIGNEIKQLSQIVTFHVARKSFITIALSKGIHAKIVQAISGHTNDSVFNRYIAFATDDLVQEMNKLKKNKVV